MSKQLSDIRLMIVDDHSAVRSGLALMISAFDDLELVAEAVNGKDAIRLCGEVNPDVVLMDLVMPEMDGIDATEVISRDYPHVKVIALTSFEDEELMNRAMKAGVVSYLSKTCLVDELVDVIRDAYNSA